MVFLQFISRVRLLLFNQDQVLQVSLREITISFETFLHVVKSTFYMLSLHFAD